MARFSFPVKNQNKNAPAKRFDRAAVKFFYVFAFLGVLNYLFGDKVLYKSGMLLGPLSILLPGTAIGMWAIYRIRRDRFGITETVRTYLTDLSVVPTCLFLSGLIFGQLFFGLFDLVNHIYISEQRVKTEYCPVIKVWDESRNQRKLLTANRIEFKFKGKNVTLSNMVDRETARQIAEEPRYHPYSITIDYKEGLLGSYIIQD